MRALLTGWILPRSAVMACFQPDVPTEMESPTRGVDRARRMTLGHSHRASLSASGENGSDCPPAAVFA